VGVYSDYILLESAIASFSQALTHHSHIQTKTLSAVYLFDSIHHNLSYTNILICVTYPYTTRIFIWYFKIFYWHLSM